MHGKNQTLTKSLEKQQKRIQWGKPKTILEAKKTKKKEKRDGCLPKDLDWYLID